MKRHIFALASAVAMAIAGCTTQSKMSRSVENDDMYFSSSDRQKIIAENKVNETEKSRQSATQPATTAVQSNPQRVETYSYSSQDVDYSRYSNANTNSNSNGSDNVTSGGNTYITNNYYDNDVFWGRTRKRWYTPSYFGMFYYSYNPWFNPIWTPGWGLSISYSNVWGWNTGWGWSSWCGYYTHYYPFAAGWGWYDPFYDPFWVYRGYYYPLYYPVSPWAYNYWGVYNSGFQNGYYYGSQANQSGGINRPSSQYGPRTNNPGRAYGRIAPRASVAFQSNTNSYGPRTANHTSTVSSANPNGRPIIVNKYTQTSTTPDSYSRPNNINTSSSSQTTNNYSRPRVIYSGNSSNHTSNNVQNPYSQTNNSNPYNNNSGYSTPRSMPSYSGSSSGGTRSNTMSGGGGSWGGGSRSSGGGTNSKPRIR